MKRRYIAADVHWFRGSRRLVLARNPRAVGRHNELMLVNASEGDVLDRSEGRGQCEAVHDLGRHVAPLFGTVSEFHADNRARGQLPHHVRFVTVHIDSRAPVGALTPGLGLALLLAPAHGRHDRERG
jgi:hypothetical protein